MNAEADVSVHAKLCNSGNKPGRQTHGIRTAESARPWDRRDTKDPSRVLSTTSTARPAGNLLNTEGAGPKLQNALRDKKLSVWPRPKAKAEGPRQLKDFRDTEKSTPPKSSTKAADSTRDIPRTGAEGSNQESCCEDSGGPRRAQANTKATKSTCARLCRSVEDPRLPKSSANKPLPKRPMLCVNTAKPGWEASKTNKRGPVEASQGANAAASKR